VLGLKLRLNVDFENKEFQIVRITREGTFYNPEVSVQNMKFEGLQLLSKIPMQLTAVKETFMGQFCSPCL
jgi:hypothetical protein